jgi:hypothetical protein
MGYTLQAVIARTELLEGKPHQVHARPVALERGLSLIRITPELYDEMNGFVASEPGDGFLYLSPNLRGWLEELSLGGAAAYVEAEFFGGTGTQGGCVYENGSCVLEPFVTNHSDASQRSNRAINTALRHLDVTVAPGMDEFETIGLGRERHTEDWLEK